MEDCRSRKDYDESHIISAVHVRRNSTDGKYQIPWRSELENREHVVIYDSRTDELPLKSDDEIFECAHLFEQYAGGLITIKILRGGYQLFSKYYPFLRTQQNLYSLKELELIKTFPNEIVDQFLYLGRREHAVNSNMMKDLKIRAFVNCTKHDDYIVPSSDSRKYFRVSIDDVFEVENVGEVLRDAANFISVAHDRGDPVLVYSDRGVSRSAAVVVAFLSVHRRMNSKDALEFVNRHRPVRPQLSLIGAVDELYEKLTKLPDGSSTGETTSVKEDD